VTHKEQRAMRRASRTAAWKLEPLRVEAVLASPLCGDAPHLDALLENAAGAWHPPGEPESRTDRAIPPPPVGAISIPLKREPLNGWLVPHCSSPITSAVLADQHEHVGKRISVENANLLAESERGAVNTVATWTKSYRLPVRVRLVERVAWFCVGDAADLERLLLRVPCLGKKRSIGYGRVREWRIEPVAADWSWYVKTPHGQLLMRPLPVAEVLGLIGYKADFAAVCAPYWHPSRYAEVLTPC